MVCPCCKAEYRTGFTRCADCDVDLVYELAKEEVPDGGEIGDLRSLWQGNHQGECVSLCLELKKASIFYDVSQSVESRSARMQVDWKYEIGVPSADYERAKKILGLEAEPVEGEAQQEALEEEEWELPAGDDSAADEGVKGDSYLRKWYPEDATLEVWSGNPKDRGFVVEMSLKENRINYRVATESDELTRVFVRPEDEARAREIVREIVDGVPPE